MTPLGWLLIVLSLALSVAAGFVLWAWRESSDVALVRFGEEDADEAPQ